MYYLLRQRSARQLLLDQTWKGATVIPHQELVAPTLLATSPSQAFSPHACPPPALWYAAILFDQTCRTVCFQRNTPASHLVVSPWVCELWTITRSVEGHANDYQQSCILSWDTAEEDGRGCSFWNLQRTQVPVQIGRWGFKYSFQSMFTCTMCHDEKDVKLN